MAVRRNLADPDYEPTDEELAGLMQRAFAHVRAQNEASLARLREEIARLTEEALRALGEPLPPRRL